MSSYYATFIDGWLKDGLCCGKNLVLHQTAELLVLPFAWLYTAVTGGERGLMLFLRIVFMGASCVTGICCYRFIARIRSRSVAFCAAMLVVCFVPFSLPAPSYNTIGMLALVCGLSLFGMAMLPRPESSVEPSRSSVWVTIALSGFAWMVAVVAYPTLAVVPVAVIGLAASMMRGRAARTDLFRASLVCATWQCVGVCLLLGVYGWTRLLDILRFTSAEMKVSDGPGTKIAAALGLLWRHPIFLVLCLVSVAIGFLPRAFGQNRNAGLVACLLLAGIVLIACATGPVLFFRGHDVVLLCALTGLGGVLPQARDFAPPVICTIYLAALLAGLVTAATATNGLYNFPIGGFAAALLGPVLLISCSAPRSAKAAQCAMLLTIALATGAQAFVYIYGEPENPLRSPAVRVRDGVFAGLLTSPDRAVFITEVTQLLKQVGRGGRTIIAVGRMPGLYLLTDMSPDALATWDFYQFYGTVPPRVDAWMQSFYGVDANKPDIIAIVTDARTRPPPAWVADLLMRYVHVQSLVSARWSLAIYQRCAGQACPKSPTLVPD